MNKVIISGNISNDIELKQTSSGTPMARFNVAVNRAKEGVDFIPIVVWNQLAENVKEYCSKGTHILVEGRIQISDYEKDGQKRYSTDVVAERVEWRNEKKQENQFKDMSIKTDFDTGNQIQIKDEDLPW